MVLVFVLVLVRVLVLVLVLVLVFVFVLKYTFFRCHYIILILNNAKCWVIIFYFYLGLRNYHKLFIIFISLLFFIFSFYKNKKKYPLLITSSMQFFQCILSYAIYSLLSSGTLLSLSTLGVKLSLAKYS